MGDETTRITRAMKAAMKKEEPVKLSKTRAVTLTIGSLWAMMIFIIGAAFWFKDNIVLAEDLTEFAKLSDVEAVAEQLSYIREYQLRTYIRDLSKDIAALEYRHESDPASWTANDATRLSEMLNDLQAAQDELDSLDD